MAEQTNFYAVQRCTTIIQATASDWAINLYFYIDIHTQWVKVWGCCEKFSKFCHWELAPLVFTSGFIFFPCAHPCLCTLYMGGRLPAVAGMPANRTFLELSAGKTDWPEKIAWFCYQRSAGDLFRHKEKRFSL